MGLSGKYVPHFKPGKELRERVNASMERYPGRSTGGSDDDEDSTPVAASADR